MLKFRARRQVQFIHSAAQEALRTGNMPQKLLAPLVHASLLSRKARQELLVVGQGVDSSDASSFSSGPASDAKTAATAAAAQRSPSSSSSFIPDKVTLSLRLNDDLASLPSRRWFNFNKAVRRRVCSPLITSENRIGESLSSSSSASSSSPLSRNDSATRAKEEANKSVMPGGVFSAIEPFPIQPLFALAETDTIRDEVRRVHFVSALRYAPQSEIARVVSTFLNFFRELDASILPSATFEQHLALARKQLADDAAKKRSKKGKQEPVTFDETVSRQQQQQQRQQAEEAEKLAHKLARQKLRACEVPLRQDPEHHWLPFVEPFPTSIHTLEHLAQTYSGKTGALRKRKKKIKESAAATTTATTPSSSSSCAEDKNKHLSWKQQLQLKALRLSLLKREQKRRMLVKRQENEQQAASEGKSAAKKASSSKTNTSSSSSNNSASAKEHEELAKRITSEFAVTPGVRFRFIRCRWKGFRVWGVGAKRFFDTAPSSSSFAVVPVRPFSYSRAKPPPTSAAAAGPGSGSDTQSLKSSSSSASSATVSTSISLPEALPPPRSAELWVVMMGLAVPLASSFQQFFAAQDTGGRPKLLKAHKASFIGRLHRLLKASREINNSSSSSNDDASIHDSGSLDTFCDPTLSRVSAVASSKHKTMRDVILDQAEKLHDAKSRECDVLLQNAPLQDRDAATPTTIANSSPNADQQHEQVEEESAEEEDYSEIAAFWWWYVWTNRNSAAALMLENPSLLTHRNVHALQSSHVTPALSMLSDARSEAGLVTARESKQEQQQQQPQPSQLQGKARLASPVSKAKSSSAPPVRDKTTGRFLPRNHNTHNDNSVDDDKSSSSTTHHRASGAHLPHCAGHASEHIYALYLLECRLVFGHGDESAGGGSSNENSSGGVNSNSGLQQLVREFRAFQDLTMRPRKEWRAQFRGTFVEEMRRWRYWRFLQAYFPAFGLQVGVLGSLRAVESSRKYCTIVAAKYAQQVAYQRHKLKHPVTTKLQKRSLGAAAAPGREQSPNDDASTSTAKTARIDSASSPSTAADFSGAAAEAAAPPEPKQLLSISLADPGERAIRVQAVVGSGVSYLTFSQLLVSPYRSDQKRASNIISDVELYRAATASVSAVPASAVFDRLRRPLEKSDVLLVPRFPISASTATSNRGNGGDGVHVLRLSPHDQENLATSVSTAKLLYQRTSPALDAHKFWPYFSVAASTAAVAWHKLSLSARLTLDSRPVPLKRGESASDASYQFVVHRLQQAASGRDLAPEMLDALRKRRQQRSLERAKERQARFEKDLIEEAEAQLAAEQQRKEQQLNKNKISSKNTALPLERFLDWTIQHDCFFALVALFRDEWNNLHPLEQSRFYNEDRIREVFPAFGGFEKRDVETVQRDLLVEESSDSPFLHSYEDDDDHAGNDENHDFDNAAGDDQWISSLSRHRHQRPESRQLSSTAIKSNNNAAAAQMLPDDVTNDGAGDRTTQPGSSNIGINKVGSLRSQLRQSEAFAFSAIQHRPFRAPSVRGLKKRRPRLLTGVGREPQQQQKQEQQEE